MMKKQIYLISVALLFSMALKAQPTEKREKYDISRDKVLYTIGYAHLDTEWNWDYPTTINEYIKNIMEENFYLFEKYPDYVFNFTGSRRYRMMKEYYPELYKKVKQYVQQGRWCISGSSVDEGEVNISSSESIIRQVLYGNNYFRKEFGTESKDYLLPDCFGFLANMPSIWNHCGLLGFSTQKLGWHSAVGIPFNVGVWNGPDGKGIIAALNATSYVGKVVPRLDRDSTWNERLENNTKQYGISFDYRYYGVGDKGGAPREIDVKNVSGSLHNTVSKFKVVLTSSDQMYKDITPELRKKLPVYSGDLLLIEHSAGSMTSEAYMKRINRKNELLAQTAEQVASIADWLGGASYPAEKLNNAWELVLGSQFHDILPGTAIPKAYEYAWNDEFIAANGFSEVLKNSVSAISSGLNTQTNGRTIVVYNPVAINREDLVTAELEYTLLPVNIKVFDQKGNALPTQIIEKEVNKLKFIFLAKVPSVGLAVFDVRPTTEKSDQASLLAVTNRSIENEFYKITFTTNGDIASILDKKSSKKLLSKPAGLEFLNEQPLIYPAWNMYWKDRKNPPIGYLNQDPSFRIIEQGPVRVALEVKRKGLNSEIDQIVSLSTGEAGKRIEVTNKADWQSTGVSLKASFPLTASNELATYNLGVGTIQRDNNNENKFEVPSKEWFDLTDKSGTYGISILEDCKFGSDKPDDNTLRLTLLYTPDTKNVHGHNEQNSQDWGIHDFKYAIYGHKGNWSTGLTPWQGEFLNQPLLAFEVPKHNGKLGKNVSLLSISSPQVGLMAFKKMEGGDYYIVRVNELLGKDAKNISINFPGKIADAYEVNGQEQKIGKADFANGKLNFDITHYTIRSFAVKFAPASNSLKKPVQLPVDLPYNQDVMSFDNNRSDGMFADGAALPAELIPGEIISEDIKFKMGNTADEQDNVVSCKGQKLNLPAGNYTKLYLLASSAQDTSGNFIIDGQSNNLKIQNWTGYIGQFYNREFALDQLTVTGIDSPFSKMDNIAWFASHRHIGYPTKNDAYQYCYMYKYVINLPKGAKSLTLPVNNKIKVFAITVAENGNDNIKVLQPLYDDFKNNKPVQLRN
ncbi:MAG: glycoside hydrolase family 38 C-terminal domain-containing protein [Bacteroidota bacterium]|nr:glycoside hydrolase family 38 C-terminal domain-containing protein [Bacteroidota bacterium]